MPAISIDRLAFGGAGIGRIDGKACFVPYTAPGDEAEIEITRSKKTYCDGVLKEVTQPSLSRVPPLCPVFGVCGGCHWQHVTYEEQCLQKERILADALWRSARIDSESIDPLLRATDPFGYRQRIQLKIHFTAGKLSVGFYRSGSHYVVDIQDHCPIAAPALNGALAEVRQLVLGSGEPDKIPQVDLAASAEGIVTAVFHYIGNDRERIVRRLADIGKKQMSLHGISLQYGRKSSLQHLYGPELMTYGLPSGSGADVLLHYSPEGFSQVNFQQNRAIVSTLIDFCAHVSIGSILDLCCGNGNFSIPLARSSGKVTGFETFHKSVQLAQRNAEHNGIDTAVYVCKDSAAGLLELIDTGEKVDLVILDPPRTGAVDVTRNLYRLNASYVIYISCDPLTLARDLGILIKSGFQLTRVQPVDMFPQTYHLESIAFLQAPA